MTTAVQAEPTDQELQQQARPIVSVIITTHNRAKLLKEAIESVLAVPQHDFTLHVLVVDDGSTDDTATLVAQYPVGYIRTSSIGMAQAPRGFPVQGQHDRLGRLAVLDVPAHCAGRPCCSEGLDGVARSAAL